MQIIETEYGLFTNNETTGKTAEEVYQEWLESKDKPVEPQPTEIELLRIEQAKANAEMIELMMSMFYGGGF